MSAPAVPFVVLGWRAWEALRERVPAGEASVLGVPVFSDPWVDPDDGWLVTAEGVVRVAGRPRPTAAQTNDDA